MSEKRIKEKRHTIAIPKYNLQDILADMTNICKAFEMNGDQLIAIILADWMMTFDMATTDETFFGYNKHPMLSFLKSHEKRVLQFRKWKKEQIDAQTKK